MRKLLVAFALSWFSASYAQPIPVRVLAQTRSTDVGGQRLVYQVKELAAASRLFKYMADETDQAVLVSVLTLNALPDGESLTTYAVIITLQSPVYLSESYLTSSLGTCPDAEIRQCAEAILSQIVAVTERQLTWFRFGYAPDSPRLVFKRNAEAFRASGHGVEPPAGFVLDPPPPATKKRR